MTALTDPRATQQTTGWRAWRPTRRLTRAVLVANLVGQVAIVVTGGAVRLTGSGLGCSTWPQCEPGQFAPVAHEATSWHPFVEFGNRTLSGVLLALGLAVVAVVWRQPRRSRDLRLLSLVPGAGVVVQAVVGGLTVLLDLHPGWVSIHFLLSMLLVAASTALLLRERAPDGPPRWVVPVRVRAAVLALVPLAALVLVLGVLTTGAGPHSGDAQVGYRFAVDPALLARVHALSVWAYLATLVAVLVLLRRSVADGRAPRAAYRAAHVLLGVTVLQGVIGYVQYLTDLPEVLVLTHMLLASLLVVALTAGVVRLRTAERD